MEVPAEAWKGRFCFSRVVDEMKSAIDYLGSTEPGKPISKTQFERLRKLEQEIQHEYEIMKKWGYEQVADSPGECQK